MFHLKTQWKRGGFRSVTAPQPQQSQQQGEGNAGSSATPKPSGAARSAPWATLCVYTVAPLLYVLHWLL